MFEIEKDMVNEEKLIYKDGDTVEIYEHNIFDGTLKKDGKKVGIWNGKGIIKDKDDDKTDSSSDDDDDGDDDDSDDDKQRGGNNLNELNKFKKLLNGGGLENENISDTLVLVGGGTSYVGHGFTFF